LQDDHLSKVDAWGQPPRLFGGCSRLPHYPDCQREIRRLQPLGLPVSLPTRVTEGRNYVSVALESCQFRIRSFRSFGSRPWDTGHYWPDLVARWVSACCLDFPPRQRRGDHPSTSKRAYYSKFDLEYQVRVSVRKFKFEVPHPA